MCGYLWFSDTDWTVQAGYRWHELWLCFTAVETCVSAATVSLSVILLCVTQHHCFLLPLFAHIHINTADVTDFFFLTQLAGNFAEWAGFVYATPLTFPQLPTHFLSAESKLVIIELSEVLEPTTTSSLSLSQPPTALLCPATLWYSGNELPLNLKPTHPPSSLDISIKRWWLGWGEINEMFDCIRGTKGKGRWRWTEGMKWVREEKENRRLEMQMTADKRGKK